MVDIISLVIAITALCTAILNHIKTSKCWGVEIETDNHSKEHHYIESDNDVHIRSKKLEKKESV